MNKTKRKKTGGGAGGGKKLIHMWETFTGKKETSIRFKGGEASRVGKKGDNPTQQFSP